MFAAHDVISAIASSCPGWPHRRFSDIGTALAQWDEQKNFSGGEDVCLGNIVRNNEIETNVRRGCHPCIYVER